jgi:hypothetical protein
MYRTTINGAVWEEGCGEGQDFLIHSNDSSDVTRAIFMEYLARVVDPYFVTTSFQESCFARTPLFRYHGEMSEHSFLAMMSYQDGN